MTSFDDIITEGSNAVINGQYLLFDAKMISKTKELIIHTHWLIAKIALPFIYTPSNFSKLFLILTTWSQGIFRKSILQYILNYKKPKSSP